MRRSAATFAATFATALAILSTTGPAFAHHPMGGMTPTTLADGLLSGIGHPIIGLDHFAFILAVGLVSAFARHRLLLPAIFALATVAGCGLLVAGTALPQVELAVTLSVLALGIVVMTGRTLPLAALISLIAVAGLFHGGAYAGAIVGAETSPLAAYLAGFAVTQIAIAGGVASAATALFHAKDASALSPRLAGALIAGIGVAFLVERVEGLLLA